MVHRRILFRAEHMMRPGTYAALAKDGVLSWVAHANGLAEISDNVSDDFPAFRRECEMNSLSYDFHQRRDGDGDNTLWFHGRDGKVAHSNNDLGANGITNLENCKA